MAFMRRIVSDNFGFGDFVFRNPETGEEIARVRNLKELQNILFAVPAESFLYHISRNHVSRWLYSRAMFPVAEFLKPITFTFIFVLVVLGSTDPKKGAGNLAGLAIGLSLVLVHIVCIPITGTSVNPARSIAPALFQGGEALSQLWLFIIAPFVGAALSAVVWNYFGDKK